MTAAEQERFEAIQYFQAYSQANDFSRTQLKEIVRRADVQVGICGDDKYKELYQALADAAMAIENRYVEVFRDQWDHLEGKTPAI